MVRLQLPFLATFYNHCTSIMAPPTEPGDKDNLDDPSPTTDNPFIKFRQFADSQISSLLQSIVGLPSAFTKQPNNARWADFDEDMRRRDDLKKRQQELKDSEAKKLTEAQGPDSGGGATEDEQMDERIARDIPLYSPVSRSLFTHLRCARSGKSRKDDWTPLEEQAPLLFNPMILDPFTGIDPRSYMRILRTITYRDLQISPLLRSDYSLLPYLLFSPYSPFQLEAPFTRSKNPSGNYIRKSRDKVEPYDGMRYADAFVDLILMTQNRPMGSVPLQTANRYLPLIEPGRGFIYSLWAHGVLQQSVVTNNSSLISLQRVFTGDGISQMDRIVANSQATERNPQTELEAYERFLRRASSSVGAAEVFDSFFNEAHDLFKGTIDSLDRPERKRQSDAVTDLLEQRDEKENEDERRAKLTKGFESLFNMSQHHFEESEQLKPTGKSLSKSKFGKELEEVKCKAAAEPGKVVSTSTTTERWVHEDKSVETKVEVWKHFGDSDGVEASCTTTEHTTNPDGSVETKIEVWKRFADGRTTTTTTSHVEDLPCANNDENDWKQPNRERGMQSPTEEKKSSMIEQKKGWFWT